MIGRPLATADAEDQTNGKAVGLAVFSSDALSSTAYATQEILVILAAAGTAAFAYSVPIALAIVGLLAIVTISYEQTIHAYPGGGGAYIVSRDNLGESLAQVAGAALLVDYILTAAVSVSSGIAQIVSAFPSLLPHRVSLAVGVVLFVMEMNLRGVVLVRMTWSGRPSGKGSVIRHGDRKRSLTIFPVASELTAVLQRTFPVSAS